MNRMAKTVTPSRNERAFSSASPKTFGNVSSRILVRVGFKAAPQAAKHGLGAAVHRERETTLRVLLAGISRLNRAKAKATLIQLELEFVTGIAHQLGCPQRPVHLAGLHPHILDRQAL